MPNEVRQRITGLVTLKNKLPKSAFKIVKTSFSDFKKTSIPIKAFDKIKTR